MTGKIVVDLGQKEAEHGLAYVALSRATKLSNIGILGLAATRLTTQISGSAKVIERKGEDLRLSGLAETTYTRIPIPP